MSELNGLSTTVNDNGVLIMKSIDMVNSNSVIISEEKSFANHGLTVSFPKVTPSYMHEDNISQINY